MMPVGHEKIREFQLEVWGAESALHKARSAYAIHVAHCLVCSRTLIDADAVLAIHEKLDRAADSSV